MFFELFSLSFSLSVDSDEEKTNYREMKMEVWREIYRSAKEIYQL